jgi:hypothetical protein
MPVNLDSLSFFIFKLFSEEEEVWFGVRRNSFFRQENGSVPWMTDERLTGKSLG